MLRLLCLILACLGLLCVMSQRAGALALVQVQGLGDMALPDWGLGDPAVNSSINLCIYNTLNANYTVSVASAGGFILKNGAKSIPYALAWDDGGAGNLGAASTALSNNVILTGRRNANVVSPVCLAGPNARLNVKITQADMIAATAGTYTGTVTIMIAPN